MRIYLTRKPFAVNTNPFFDNEPADKDWYGWVSIHHLNTLIADNC